jgi:hypothetical protein
VTSLSVVLISGRVVTAGYLVHHIVISPVGGSLRIVIAGEPEGSRRDCNTIEKQCSTR